MIRFATLGLLFAGIAAPALAADEAADKKVTAAIVETIKMTTAGELDKWMDQYCDPSKCRDAGARSELKAYQLKSANKWSKACLLEGDTIEVKQRKGEVTDADGALWYLRCEGRQLGVPVRARYDKETDRVWFLQLGF